MVSIHLSRRAILTGLAALAALPTTARADEVIDLEWDDLLPLRAASVPKALQGVIQHDEAPLASQIPQGTDLRTDWNGKTVRLPGYVVPIEYDGTGVVTFILVPFVGACVHVPPPPPNQLVLVTTEEPYEIAGFFEAVNVTGMFGAAHTSTQIAEIGYALSADKIEPHGL